LTLRVGTLLDACPHLVDAKGPPGIPLRFHAEQGGEQATEVAALLDERAAAAAVT
jgi:hypothetical protein